MSASFKRSGQIGTTKSKTGCRTCKSVFHRKNSSVSRPSEHASDDVITGYDECAVGKKGRIASDALAPVECAVTAHRLGQLPRESSKVLTPALCNLSTHLKFSCSPWGEQQAGWRERRAFEFYFHQASPLLSGDLDLAFWRGCVLQTCRIEPAVWDAIISLSALYERPPLHDTPPFRLINAPATVRSQTHREALVWYSRSLSALQQRINQGTANLDVSLISCILFIAIELLQGNRSAALGLYKQGAQLIINAGRGPWVATLVPIFRRLGTWVFINDGSRGEDWSFHIAAPRSRFVSIDEARNVLCGIVAEMKTLDNDRKFHWKQAVADHKHEALALEVKRDHLRGRLAHWHGLFVYFQSSDGLGSQDASSSVDGASALLLMTYTSVLIEIETILSPDQVAYDQYELEFRAILEYASSAIAATRTPDGTQPPFTFEMGVFLPLFITALKCRFPQLRRHALQLMMEEAPPAQGLFMCGPAAHVIAAIVTLEENPNLTWEGSFEISRFFKEPGCIPLHGIASGTLVCRLMKTVNGDPKLAALQSSRL